MDSILADLGVEIQNEDQAAREVLREKILSQICVGGNPLLPPSLGAPAPKLSSDSVLTLAQNLKTEISDREHLTGDDDRELVISKMKYKFLRLLMTDVEDQAVVSKKLTLAASKAMDAMRARDLSKVLAPDQVQDLSEQLLEDRQTYSTTVHKASESAFIMRPRLNARKELSIDDSELMELQREALAVRLMDKGENEYENENKNENGYEYEEARDREREQTRRQRLEMIEVNNRDESASSANANPSPNHNQAIGHEDYDDTPVLAANTSSSGVSSSSSSSSAMQVAPSRDASRLSQEKETQLKLKSANANANANTSSSSPDERRAKRAKNEASRPQSSSRTKSKAKKRVKVESQKHVDLTCPLCSGPLRCLLGQDQDGFLAQHMGNCDGSDRSRRKAIREAEVEVEVIDLVNEDEEDEEEEGELEEEEYEYDEEGLAESEEEAEFGDEEGTKIKKKNSSSSEDAKTSQKKHNRLQKNNGSSSSSSSSRNNNNKAQQRQRPVGGLQSLEDDDNDSDMDMDMGDGRAANLNISGNISGNLSGKVKEAKTELLDDWEDHYYFGRLAKERIERARDEEVLETSYRLKVPKKVWELMHAYQRDGCEWLAGLHKQGIGGILGDEMGLGKTIQLCVHFNSLAMRTRETTQGKDSGIFLIVSPATVIHHWLRELHKWVPSMRTVVIHSISKTGQELARLGEKGVEFALRRLQKDAKTRGLVAIITYEGLRRYKNSLVLVEWTAVCLDEGQKIRNPNADITAVCKMLPSFHRIILSGTPIQNNLTELWSLIDFCYPGRLGSLAAFDTEFAAPIRVAGYAGAGKLKQEIAVRIATTLQRVVRPILLRRRKDDKTLNTALPGKTEQVLFCKLASRQRDLYHDILNSPEVERVLLKRAMAFRAITTLRKLCNHPGLVYQHGKILWHDETKDEAAMRIKQAQRVQQRKRVRGGGKKSTADSSDDEGDGEGLGNDDDGHELKLTEGLTWRDSGKLLVLSKVLPLWLTEGHKVLLFSQTQSMLNLMEIMMKEFSFRYMRLDGSTPVHRREGIIDTFNSDDSVFIMLLTTRTGGMGISLTAANRVVLVDPDWNPQTDVQARERAWRLGQKRDVTIYRLITRGTIEEKIYQRQIFKILLSNRILDNPNQKAFFSKTDISDLFQLTDHENMPREARVGLKSKKPADKDVDDIGRQQQQQQQQQRDSLVESRNQIQASSSSSSSSSSTSALARGRRMQVEDGEISSAAGTNTGTGTGTKIPVSGESSLGLDIETFVEQDVPDELLGAGAGAAGATGSAATGGPGGGDKAKDQGERDRRLLKVLYDGEAISSVYDHSYLEPGAGGSNRTDSTMTSLDRRRAERSVSQAVQNLTSSARSYTNSTAAGPLSGPGSGAGGRGSGSNTATNALFGQVSLNRPDAISSSGLLAGLRGRAGAAGIAGGRGGRGQGRGGAGVGAGSSRSQPSFSVNMNDSSSNITVRASAAYESVEENMEARLEAVFANATVNAANNRNGRAGRGGHGGRGTAPPRIGLTTEFILGQFRDIGDQYAPLFRTVLRQVAYLENGLWRAHE